MIRCWSGRKRLAWRAAFSLAEQVFDLTARDARQFFKRLRRDGAGMAGQERHDLARRDAGGLGPIAGPEMTRNHEGAEGVALVADLLTAPERVFGIGAATSPISTFGLA